MTRILLAIIRGYQIFVSPIFHGLGCTCRFHPACSEYAHEAIVNYKWWKAIGLIFFRVIRCSPWHPGGYNPVPMK